MPHYAHSVAGRSTEHWQPLAEHLTSVAALAERSGEKFGASRAAFVAGLLHDLGKYTEDYQCRLHGGPKVDHATAGAKMILPHTAPADRLVAELIAYAIAGHHGGMPDRRGGDHSTLDLRLERELPELSTAWQAEIGPLPDSLAPARFDWHADPKFRPFQLALLARFLFSCLVDADFRDTEGFYARIEGRSVARDILILLGDLKVKLDRHLAALCKG